MAILRDLLVNSTARILGSLYAKNVTADVFKGNLMGKFSTARKIGNAPFDGSADISLSQIGAAAVSHSHSYLPLSGGTLSGVLTLKSGVYTDDYIGALNANNSNIYGINSLIFADLSDSSAEGIQFYRTNTTVDSFWAKNGILYFTPNRTLGSNAADYTIIHTGNINSHAAPVSHTHSYLPLTGGTVSGPINSSKVTSTYLAGNQGQSIINSTVSAGSYVMLAKMNSTNGYFTHGAYQGKYLLQYTAKSTVDAGTNNVTKSVTLLNEAGNTSFLVLYQQPLFLVMPLHHQLQRNLLLPER